MNNIEEKQRFVSNIFYHFNLRQVKEEKPTPIYLVVRLNGKQYKYPIGCKVLPSQWSKKTERPIISSCISRLDNKNNSITHKKIQATELQLKEIFQYLCNHPEEENVLQVFNNALNKGNMTTKNNTNVILDLKKMIDNDKTISEGSKKAYFTVVTNFNEYIQSLGREILGWNDIESNPQLLLDYSTFLYNSKSTHKHKITKEEGLPLSVITVNNRLTVICGLFTNAKDKGLTNVTDDVINKLRRCKTDNDKTYEHQLALTEDEIISITNLQLDGMIERARDLFLFQLEVGQRYEDINGLTPIVEEKEEGNNKGCFFKIYQSKTSKYVYPPVTQTARNILDKYDGSLPNIPIGKIDLLLKDVARAANIIRKVECNEKRGGNDKYSYQVEGWRLMGTHTARRTFVTRWKRKGLPIDDIMKLTGHTSTETAKRYNRITDTEIGFKFLNQSTYSNEALQPIAIINDTLLDKKVMAMALLEKLEIMIRENERLRLILQANNIEAMEKEVYDPFEELETNDKEMKVRIPNKNAIELIDRIKVLMNELGIKLPMEFNKKMNDINEVIKLKQLISNL